MQELIDRYLVALYSTDHEKAKRVIYQSLEKNIQPEDIVFKVIIPAIETMARLFIHENQISLSQHYLSSKISEEIVDEMLPLFTNTIKKNGVIIIGTSAGDFHGLGKKIVAGCLRAYLYTVHDIGLNVAPRKFIDEALKHGAQIIGVSSMMMHTATGEEGPIKVKRLLEEDGLSGQIKLMVGGAPYKFDTSLYQKIAADAWADNGYEAISVVEKLMKSCDRNEQ